MLSACHELMFSSAAGKRHVRGARRWAFAIAVTLLVIPSGAGSAMAVAPPVKELLKARIGAKVDATTGSDVCTVESKDVCQPGEASGAAGGFDVVDGIATAPAGAVYAVDPGNHRVQEFAADGTFTRMFGLEVNESAHERGEAEGEDICPVKAGDKCRAGVESVEAGAFATPVTVAVDPKSGDVYVGEYAIVAGKRAARLQKLTPEGRFIYEIGEEVNKTTKGNFCSQEEIEAKSAVCGFAKLYEATETQPPSDPIAGVEPKVAVGGPEATVYVADGNRVQVFEAGGKYIREIKPAVLPPFGLTPIRSLAADSGGNVYVAYETGNVDVGAGVIYKFSATGQEVGGAFPLTLQPRTPQGKSVEWRLNLEAIAVSPSGRIGLVAQEANETASHALVRNAFGALLNETTGHVVTEFAVPSTFGVFAMAFDEHENMYLAPVGLREALVYGPVPVGEVVTTKTACTTGAVRETSATIDCQLKGEANPYEIAETNVRFQWGSTCANVFETPVVGLPSSSAPDPIAALIEGLIPNETYCYRLVGEDANVKLPELLTGEWVPFVTPVVPPTITAQPVTLVVGAFSAVLFGELNPQHAQTHYWFDFGACKSDGSCEGTPFTSRSSGAESSAYGYTITVQEASGLQPGTTYHYKLKAINAAGVAVEAKVGEFEGEFTTAPAPRVQVETGGAEALGPAEAVIHGSVDPRGLAAAYRFEIGLDNGAETRYATVYSGAIGEGTVTPVEESVRLYGLQPGMQYAYRIVASGGTGGAAGSLEIGASKVFTTPPLPDVFMAPPLELLPLPAVQFPKPATPGKGDVALGRALKACAKKHDRRKRRVCERRARERYGKARA